MITVTATVPMTTAQTPKLYGLVAAILVLLIAAALHIFVLALLVEAGKSADVNGGGNFWLDAAEKISWNNPAVYEAQANYYRGQGLLKQQSLDGKTFKIVISKDSPQLKSLNISLHYWNAAIKSRPLWPYYQLGALDVEVLQASSASILQSRVGTIINLAPNERGLYRNMLQLALIAWKKLNLSQQEFMLERLALVSNKQLRLIFNKAKAAGNHKVICVRLPWKKVRQLCS